jgi:hypothetical protein
MSNLNHFKISIIAVFSLFSLLIFIAPSNAQTLPLSWLENIQDSVRNSQLMGKDTTSISYLIRPLNQLSIGKRLYHNSNEKIQISLMPLLLQQQINSHHPYGMNDNSMIPAKGYQSMISAGLFIKAGPLQIQVYPEYVYAENKEFTQLERVGNDIYYAYPAMVYNRIDNLSRFGNKQYSKFNLGQSSIRLNFNPVSLGLSNENIWWGPGRRNSLSMTNNSAGFKHFTLNTTRPIDIEIGKVEAQVILGGLESSSIPIPENLLGSGTNDFKSKLPTWRTIAAFAATYQPKWVPGLSVGFDRSAVAYHNDRDNAIKLSSLFARWVMPESNTEVYVQYGRNKHTKDSLGNAQSSNAYLVGFNKLIPLNRTDEYIQAGFEFTQLEVQKNGSLTKKPSWYTDDVVAHGFTNRGEVLGAGIGPGSNMQSLDVSWIKGYKRIGVVLDRIVHNNDFFYNAGYPITDLRRNWVDLAVSGKLSWNFSKLILNTQLTYIKSLNYQWNFKNVEGVFFWDMPKEDKSNVQAKVGLMYNF